MADSKIVCIYCERSEEEVPLIQMRYRGGEVYICPQHLPILIHQPERLAGKLPGAENLAPGEEHNH